MSTHGFPRQVAVLGAGLMGSQIAAHLANAGIQVLLFDLPGDNRPNASASAAIQQLHRLHPPPFTSPYRDQYITPANYNEHLDNLADCDLIIEAISDNIDDKQGFYARISPYLSKRAIVTTCTSHLSINQLACTLSEDLRSRFCGMQFFNPPRYRKLVELIGCDLTDQQVLDRLETFLVRTLGKGVIQAKDSPLFVANRIGLFALTATIHHAECYSLTPAQVDVLTASAFGFNDLAIFGNVDLIGLDQIAETIALAPSLLPDDPWLGALTLPTWFDQLVGERRLGRKTGSGIYRWHDGQREVIDCTTGDYHPVEARIASSVCETLTITDNREKFTVLRIDTHPQAQFLWSVLRDVTHYACFWLTTLADTTEDIDSALRWGFNWRQGPFEVWQSIGWQPFTQWLQDDLSANKTLVPVALPDWVNNINSAYNEHGSYAPSAEKYLPSQQLPVYQRQRLSSLNPVTVPDRVRVAGNAVTLWDAGDEIAIASFTITTLTSVDLFIDELQRCLHTAEEHYKALILVDIDRLYQLNGVTDQQLNRCQQACLTLRHSLIPIVGTIADCAQGYGAELQLYCDAIIANVEARVGFPRLHDGLLPCRGGGAAIARRAQEQAKHTALLPTINTYFDHCTSGALARCAEEAQEWGLLRSNDTIVFNAAELVYVAKVRAQTLAESGYRPPIATTIRVAGRAGEQALQEKITRRIDAGQLNQNAATACHQFAKVLCGSQGDAEAEYEANEQDLLQLERQVFLEINNRKT